MDIRRDGHLSWDIASSVQLLKSLRAAVPNSDRAKDLDQRQMRAACERLIALAHTARRAGLSTYCSLCLHVLEQLNPLIRANYMTLRMAAALRTWIRLSLKYLRDPKDLSASAELIDYLEHPHWERPVGKHHREALLAGLLGDWVKLREQEVLPARFCVHSGHPFVNSGMEYAVW
jgi:hypothetical protein